MDGWGEVENGAAGASFSVAEEAYAAGDLCGGAR
jgi:hypothetical protein